MATYCEKCFEPLVPTDERKGYDTFFECNNCKRKYHEIHWSGTCEACQSNEAAPVTIIQPRRDRLNQTFVSGSKQQIDPPLTFGEHIDLTQATEQTDIRPTRTPIDLRPYIRYVVQLVGSMVVGIALIVISTAVGSFTPQVWEARPTDVRMILDAVVAARPATLIILSALVGAAGASLVFYHQTAAHQPNQWLWRLLTALAIVVLFQIIANGMTLEDYANSILNELRFTTNPLTRQWIAMGAAVLIILPLALVYYTFGRISDIPYIAPSPLLIAWSILRFLVVSLVLATLAVTFAMYNTGILSTTLNADAWWLQWLQQAQTPPFLAALVVCIGVVAALYYPPARSNMPRQLGCARFALVVLAVVGVIALYSTTTDRDLFLAAVAVAGVMMIALIPAQRVYS